MSRENLDLVYRAYDAQRRRDLEEFLGYFDPAVEFRSRLVDIEGTLYGHEGVREWWATLMDVFPDWNGSILEARDLGDWVLIHGRGQGSGAGSGAGVGEDYWQAVEIRNGRCVRYITCRTRSEALEAAGLRE